MSADIYKQACRVCLKEDTKPLNIFENPSRNECFAVMLTAIADVKILEGDSLPENVCSSCGEVIIKAFKLKALVENTNAFLQLMSKQIIIRKLDPELIKLKKNSQVTVTTEPKENNLFTTNDIFDNKRKGIESNAESIKLDILFDGDSKNKKVVYNNDFSSEPLLKKRENSPIKEDIFLNDININNNESLFGNDDHFADNDYFDISYSINDNEPVSKKPSLMKKAINQTVQKSILTNRKLQIVTKGVVMNDNIKSLPRSKPNHVTEPKIKLVSDNEGFVCTVCGLKVYNIQRHMNTHKEHKFTCPVCKMGFVKKSDFLTHTTIVHNDVTRDFICDMCPLTFFTKKSLYKHKEVHAEKTFECDNCQLRFNARWALQRHRRKHLGVRPYVCQCGQAFADRARLLQHERVHTGEKLYECQICDVSFSYKCNLNNHVLKQHGINIKFHSLHKVTEESLQLVLEIQNKKS